MIESEIEILKKGQVYEGVVERYTFPNKGYVKVEDRDLYKRSTERTESAVFH